MAAKTLLTAAIILLSATSAMSRPPVTESKQTVGVFGISIPFGGDMQPRFSLGVRKGTVQADGSLRGAEIRLTINPVRPQDMQLRALGLVGTVDHSGALGGGWNFGTGQPFLSGGVLLPHFNVIGDFGLSGVDPSLSIGLDSAGAFSDPVDYCLGGAAPESITLAC